METLSDHRLPFTIEIPDGCSIIRKQNSLNASQPCIVIQSSGFYTNLIWGPTYGTDTDTPPPGYELENRESIGQGDNKVNMIVAHTSASSPISFAFLLVRSLIVLAIIGTISFIVLTLLKADPSLSWWIGLAGSALSLIFGHPKIMEYAFTYKGEEYVFTGPHSQKELFHQVIRTIRFNS